MIAKTNSFSVLLFFFYLMFVCNIGHAQEKIKNTKVRTLNKVYNSEVRGTNALSLAFGTAIANADYPEALLEVNMHVAYKLFLGPYVNINIGYNKYNLAFKDVFNEGFMSFDANLEIIPFPNNIFSPFVCAGGGINASNYFVTTDSKVQGGAGFEVLISPKVGIKLFAEYNFMFTDQLDGRIYGASDDAFWRAAIGCNFYFGNRGKRRHVNKNEPTVINSNPIIHSKN